MPQIEIILGLLLAVAALVTVARRIDVPYPVLLVIGGLALGLIPGLPRVELAPELVFLLFLPPLIYWEALNSSFRDFRANMTSISLLAVGLVLATMCVVAVVAHAAVDHLSWAAAFTLGAIVAPTDAVSATAVFERLGVPRTLATVVEGESLVNDATAIVAYRVAVAAVVSGSFSLWNAGAQFIYASAGGILIGLAVGWAIGQVRRRLSDPPVENTISLLSGFAAYLPADHLGFSGVLAVVATGFYLGRVGPRYVSSRTRIQAQEMWGVLIFLLNGLIFILIGLQLRRVLDALAGYAPATLIRYAALISATVILVRMVWVFPGTVAAWRLDARRRQLPLPPWQHVTLVGWAGMSGVVSLAAALALPFTTHSGAPFPERDLIVFLTFSVILVTLVLKGLSLPFTIRLLGIEADGDAAREEAKARYKAARAALARLDQLAAEQRAPAEKIEHLRALYQRRMRHFSAHYHDESHEEEDALASGYEQLRRTLLLDERQAVIRLRDDGVINDEVLRRIQRDLDLEELQLG
jgi:CPA1 family monovalent cation:H+ antiporter